MITKASQMCAPIHKEIRSNLTTSKTFFFLTNASKPGKKVIIYYTQSLKFNITNQAIFFFLSKTFLCI